MIRPLMDGDASTTDAGATDPGAGSGRLPAREAVLAVAGFLALGLVVAPGLLFGECFFYGDFHAVFEPLRAALGRELARGLPLWSDELSHGQPLLASPFAAALYPPNLFFALAPGEAGRLLSLLTLLHLAWGAAGAFLLARRRGASRAAAACAGTVFAFSGAALSGSYLTLLCFSSAWLPWFLLAAEAALRSAEGGRSTRVALGLGVATAFLVTAGDPFVIASAFLGALLTTRPPRSTSARTGLAALRPWLPLAGGIALGLTAAFPLIASAASYVRATARGAGLPAESVLGRSLHPLSLLELVVPGAFGNVFLVGEGGFFAHALHDGSTPLFPSLYVGALALGLAVGGLATRERGAGREGIWLVIQVVLALGRYLPLAPLLATLPVISSTRYPAKWLLPAMLPIALLAARGIDAVVRDAGRAAGASRLRSGALALLALPLGLAAATPLGADRAIAALLAPSPGRETTGPSMDRAGLSEAVRGHVAAGALRAALPVAGALLLGALLARRRSGSSLAPALAALVAADLVSAGQPQARTVPASFYSRRPAAVDLILADDGAAHRVWVDASPEARAVPLRLFVESAALEHFARLRRESLDGLVGASYGLRLAFAGDLERLAPVFHEQYQRLVETLPARERAALLRAASVSHVFSPLDRSGAGVVPVGAVPGLFEPRRVFTVPAPLPAIRVVGELRPHDGPAGLARILAEEPEDYVDRVAFVERRLLPGAGERVFPPGGAPGPPCRWTVRPLEERPARLVVEVSGPAGFLVVAGSWAPGWRARVDGRDAPLVPVNLAFRGVPFPAGDHRVEMSYSPF